MAASSGKGAGLTGTVDLGADGCGCTAAGLTPVRGFHGVGPPPPLPSPTKAGSTGAQGPLDDGWAPPTDKRAPPRYEPGSCNEGTFQVEGASLGDLAALDGPVLEYMTTNQVPNGAVAVVAGDGRLVYCKAFTWCQLLEDKGEEVYIATVHSRFRVASVSKAITAVATMAALDRGLFGKDRLHTKAAEFTDFSTQFWGSFPVVGQLWDIELWHLLTHSAGWGEYPGAERRDYLPAKVYTGSPQYMFEKNDHALAAAYGACLPLNPLVIRWDQNRTALSGWGIGSTWSYSNHGFVLLGQILAEASGVTEAEWVRQVVWDPIGATDATPGRTLLADRQAEEVKYYARYWPSVPYSDSTSVMRAACFAGEIYRTFTDYQPYAYHNLENALGGSGWACSVYDLALLMRDLFSRDRFGVNRSVILSQSALTDLLTPRLPKSSGVGQCLAFETTLGRTGQPTDFYKTGHLDGTNALIYNYGSVTGRPESHASVVYVFNRFWRAAPGTGGATFLDGVPRDAPEVYADMPYPEEDLKQALDDVIRAATDWGTGDLRGTL